MKISRFVFCCLIILSINNVFSQEIFPAVMHGDLDRVKILIEEHPEWANATSWGGWTPLHRASQFGHGDIVGFLILKGSHLEAKTDLGMTPLYAAIMGQKSEVVKQLINKGADVFAVRNEGETMLHIAAAMGQKDIVELLISKGLEVDVTRRYGITPLHLASVFGHKTTVEALISNGADIDRKNDNGSTALHLASAAGETQTVALLKEKGASDVPEEYVKITGDYLGQKKPGSTPELFGPGILLNTHRFDIEGGFGSVDIYRSRLTRDGYEKPENLGDSINTEFMDTLPYIAPDESYLLFSSMRPDGYGDFDLYVSYKKEDGTWTKAKNMCDTINTPARESSSIVSPDGKYLFFMSRRNGIGEFFWVDAKIIEELKPKEINSISSNGKMILR